MDVWLVIQFSFYLLGVAIPLVSAIVYRKIIKLPEGKPNDVTGSHFALYGLFLIVLLLTSLFVGFHISPNLPEPYAITLVAFIFGIMSGAMAMAEAFPFFMVGPDLKDKEGNKKILKFGLILLVLIFVGVATVTTGIIFFQ